MNHLIIIRGLSGSGKSYLAKKLNGYVHYEADMFFTDSDGKYNFDVSLLTKAHQWCYNQTLRSLEEGKNVVVSNTFSRIWEMEPYIELGYPFSVIICEGNYGNIHNVPEEVIERMRLRWEFL